MCDRLDWTSLVLIRSPMKGTVPMTSTPIDTRPATRTPDMLRPAGIAVLLSAVLTAVLLARNTNDGPAWRVGLVLGVAIAVGTALVFGLAVRLALRKESGRRSAWTALALGVVTVLSVVVFWLALPPVFGVATLILARDARDRRPFRGEAAAITGAVLATLGTFAAFVIAVLS
jgi:hypothetical protein